MACKGRDFFDVIGRGGPFLIPIQRQPAVETQKRSNSDGDDITEDDELHWVKQGESGTESSGVSASSSFIGSRSFAGFACING